MIAYLILAWLKFPSGIGFSLQQMFQLLNTNLFDSRNLEDLLKSPGKFFDHIKNDYRTLSCVA